MSMFHLYCCSCSNVLANISAQSVKFTHQCNDRFVSPARDDYKWRTGRKHYFHVSGTACTTTVASMETTEWVATYLYTREPDAVSYRIRTAENQPTWSALPASWKEKKCEWEDTAENSFLRKLEIKEVISLENRDEFSEPSQTNLECQGVIHNYV